MDLPKNTKLKAGAGTRVHLPPVKEGAGYFPFALRKFNYKSGLRNRMSEAPLTATQGRRKQMLG